jgi:peroxiredoxin
MDSRFANKAFAESIGVTFPLLSDWGGDVTRTYGLYNERSKEGRRVTFLIDKTGHVTAMQKDREAIDPSDVIKACSLGEE